MEIFRTSLNYDHLNRSERKSIINKLSRSQLQTIEQYKQYKFNSMLLNDFNETGTEWQFREEQVNPNFDKSNPKESSLHCSCGRGVKYLYICQSKENNRTQGFGIEHLKQEAGIGEDILRDIKKGKHKIDRGLDEILIRFQWGETFPSQNYQLLKEQNTLESLFSKNKLVYLQEFCRESLPIYLKDELTINKAAKQLLEEQKQIERKKWLRTPAGIKFTQEQELLAEQEKLQAEREDLWKNNSVNQSPSSQSPNNNPSPKETVIKNARITFKQVFSRHQNIAELYGIESSSDLDVLIINSIFGNGFITRGKAVIPKETVFISITMLNKKFNLEISDLENRLNEIYAILEHEQLIIDKRGMKLAAY
ncbi:hypothetical protein [Companilactobacillus sp. HBUAS59544]|uniref:hypothetical protein n=1 Tax=Companilactobacillus sp. HBUAS59544 TaxID=3109363 RepID=UPI002FF0F34D